MLPGVYTKAQERAIIWIPRVSSFLSIIGSSLILFMISRGTTGNIRKGNFRKSNEHKLSKLHNRLLLVMCICNILSSFALGFSSTFMPNEFGSYIIGAVGNKFTCIMQGFFINLSGAVISYNAMLCLYYMLVIKYNTSDETLEKYERYMHGFALGLPLLCGILGISFDLYHPDIDKGHCWLYDGCSTYPMVKTNFECQSQPQDFIFVMLVFTISKSSIAFIIIATSMTATYLSVRKQTITMKKYSSFTSGNALAGNEEKKGVKDETWSQASLYVLSAFLTHIFAPFAAFLEQTEEESLVNTCMFVFTIFSHGLYPLQGAFNFAIYVRPRYILLQEKMKDDSFLCVLNRVVFHNSEVTSAFKKEEKADKVKARLERIRRASLKNNISTSNDEEDDEEGEEDNDLNQLDDILHEKQARHHDEGDNTRVISLKEENDDCATSIDKSPISSPLFAKEDDRCTESNSEQERNHLEPQNDEQNDRNEKPALSLSLLVAQDIVFDHELLPSSTTDGIRRRHTILPGNSRGNHNSEVGNANTPWFHNNMEHEQLNHSRRHTITGLVPNIFFNEGTRFSLLQKDEEDAPSMPSSSMMKSISE